MILGGSRMLNDFFLREKISRKFPIIRLFKETIVNGYRKRTSNYGKKVLDIEEGGSLLGNLILKGEPFMAARLGATELSTIMEFLENKKTGRNWSEPAKKKISTLSGFFPANDEMLDAFSYKFLKDVTNTDVMGVWNNPGEDKICREFCRDTNFVSLRALEPYYATVPWSSHLKNKKVLVIHPFDDLIRFQYEKRKKLFKNENILPDFELTTIKAIQSIANNETSFENWFEALNFMCEEIEKKDFDIAIIGAGAYGLPLASFIKQIGKQAIHMGGATQVLFGIKGKRWDDHTYISKLYNDSWIRPGDSYKPKNHEAVEGGCYW